MSGTTSVRATNALLYPGLGLGTIVSGAQHVTDGMLLAHAHAHAHAEAVAVAVAGQVDVSERRASLLPDAASLRAPSATVAVAVAKAAYADEVTTIEHDDLIQAVQDAMWVPEYPMISGGTGH